MGKPFFGGVPTGPDVEKLNEAFGVPGPGVIPYADVETVLGFTRGESRWDSVTDAWRKALRDKHNLEVRAVLNVGFKVLTEVERIEDARGALRQTTRRAREANRRAVSIDSSQLCDVDRTKRDHLCRATAFVASAAVAQSRQIATLLSPPPQLPRSDA